MADILTASQRQLLNRIEKVIPYGFRTGQREVIEQVFRDVLDEAGAGSIIDGVGTSSVTFVDDWPTPTEEDVGRVFVNRNTREERSVFNEAFRTDHPVATWASLRDYLTADDADLTIFHRAAPQLTAASVGKFYYDTYDNTFYEAVEASTGVYRFQHVGAGAALVNVARAYFDANEGGELAGGDSVPVVYLGEGHDDDGTTEINLPQHTVDLTTRYFVYFNFIGNDFEILTDYTPANGLVDHYVWRRLRAEAINPILRPVGGVFPAPDEELFREHAVLLDDAGQGYGVRSFVHVGQEERAVFAHYYSSPSDSAANRGRENAVAWASGVDYKVGDRRTSGASGFYVCVQDHTSTAGGATGDPDDENTGWEAYWDESHTALVLPNRSNFRGYYGRSSDVSSPQVGDWIVTPYQNTHVGFLRYENTGGPLFGTRGWFTYTPFSHVLGAFSSEDAARAAIRSFDAGTRTVALIGTDLVELTYYAERTTDTHGYEWVAAETAVRETLRVVRRGTSVEIPASAMAASANANAEHGLGHAPDYVEFFFECVTAEKEYAVGDKVAATESSRASVAWNETHVYIALPEGTSQLRIPNRDGGGNSEVTLGSWKAVAIPFAYDDREVLVPRF